jgi:hypothetical protein
MFCLRWGSNADPILIYKTDTYLNNKQVFIDGLVGW